MTRGIERDRETEREEREPAKKATKKNPVPSLP